MERLGPAFFCTTSCRRPSETSEGTTSEVLLERSLSGLCLMFQGKWSTLSISRRAEQRLASLPSAPFSAGRHEISGRRTLRIITCDERPLLDLRPPTGLTERAPMRGNGLAGEGSFRTRSASPGLSRGNAAGEGVRSPRGSASTIRRTGLAGSALFPAVGAGARLPAARYAASPVL
jgi:hypothetical protein